MAFDRRSPWKFTVGFPGSSGGVGPVPFCLKNLGREIGRSTVERILRDRGIEPAPQRGERTSWGTFLTTHWEALAAADFFTVEVLTLGGLVRYFVFFVMRLKTRTVEIARITCQPTEAWMKRIARNLIDSHNGFLHGMGHLVLDRDPLFTAVFRRLLRDSGVKPLLLPARSPNLSAFSERFVLSIKSECLERMVLLGEAHLRTAALQYLEHYHRERPHQGLRNGLLVAHEKILPNGPVKRHQRLGGLLNFYYREAV